MQTIRVLHLSDLHLTEQPEYYVKLNKDLKKFKDKIPKPINRPLKDYDLKFPFYDIAPLRKISEIVSKLQDQIDAILISGDIVAAATEGDLQYAVRFFSKYNYSLTSQNNKAPLNIGFFNKKIIVVPGNHDRYHFIAGYPTGLPKKDLFDKYLYILWKGGVGGVEVHLLPINKDPALAIICCDFSLEKLKHVKGIDRIKGGHFGQGKVYDDRLKNLLDETNKVKTEYPSIPIIWMNHFAPNVANIFGLKDNIRLIDCKKLIKAATNANIEHLLCGHTHLSKRYDPRNDSQSDKYTMSDSSIKVYCAGTSTCIDEKSDTKIHFMNIKIDGSELHIEPLDFKWDNVNQNFFYENTPWEDYFFPDE